MGATVRECTIEIVEEATDATEHVATAGRSTTETEADKALRQLLRRRKTTRARQALLARRTR